MEFIRASTRYFVSSLLSLLLLALPVVFIAQNFLSSPDQIKKSLQAGDTYTKLTDSAVQQLSANTQDPNIKNALQDPNVQQVIKNAYPASIVQAAAENAIDSFYAWLNGSSQLPRLSLRAPEARQQLITNIATYAENRANQLPACTRQQLLTLNREQNILTIPCLPPGVNTKILAAEAASQVTAGTTFLDQAEQTIQPTPQLEQLRDNYLRLKQMQWWIIGSAAALAVVYLFLSSTKLAGLKGLSILVGVDGLILLIGVKVVGALLDKTLSSLQTYSVATDVTVNTATIVKPLVGNVSHGFVMWGGGYVLAGLIGFAVAQLAGRQKRT